MIDEHDIVDREQSDETNRERLIFLLRTLGDMGETLTEGESFDSAARYLLRMLLGAIGISNGAIFTYRENHRKLRLKVTTRGAHCDLDEIKLSARTALQMAEDASPHLTDNLPDYLKTGLSELIEHWDANRIKIIIPLAVKNQLLGMVCLGQRFMNQDYSSMDMEVLGLLTRHISLYFNSQRSLEQARTANFELRRKILEMEQLYDVGLSITSLKTSDELLEDILVRAVSILDASFGAIWVLRDDAYELAKAFGFTSQRDVPPIMPDLTGASQAKVESMSEMALSLLAPMRAREDLIGVLCVAGRESRHGGFKEFSDENCQLLTSLANQAAVALDNASLHEAAIEKERMDQELTVAAEIQETLLPGSFPQLPDLDIAALTLPCRTVGGDFFDFFTMADKRLGMVIADVSGKSVPAALLVSTFHGALHAMCETVPTLEELTMRLNELLVETTPDNRFVTAAFAIWDAGTRCVTTLSAGHEPVLLLRNDRTFDELNAGGLIMGMISGATYTYQRTRLNPGDVLCLYTDGVTDRINPHGERFGCDRLKTLLKTAQCESANDYIQTIFRELAVFAEDVPAPDDQTMIVIVGE